MPDRVTRRTTPAALAFGVWVRHERDSHRRDGATEATPLARRGRRPRCRRCGRRPRARRRAPERAARPGHAGRAAVGGRRAPAGARAGGLAATPRSSPASTARCGCRTDERLRAAVALLPAGSPTLLPAAFAPWAANRETVRLRSGYDAWRYRYSVPTAPVRSSTPRRPRPGSPRSPAWARPTAACDALASAVVVPDARRLELGKRAAFFSGLPPVLPTSRPPVPRASERSRGDHTHRSGARRRRTARAHGPPPPSSRRYSDGDSASRHRARSPRQRPRTRARARRARPDPAPYADAGRVAVADAPTRELCGGRRHR